MNMTDPIADLLTRIRNANIANHEHVDVPASRLKEQVARVLKREGFVKDYQMIHTGVQGTIRIHLKYGPSREKVITGLKRISKPGLRVYVGKEEVPKIFGGLGTVIMSTPRGVMTGKQARRQGMGGEVLCYVW